MLCCVDMRQFFLITALVGVFLLVWICAIEICPPPPPFFFHCFVWCHGHRCTELQNSVVLNHITESGYCLHQKETSRVIISSIFHFYMLDPPIPFCLSVFGDLLYYLLRFTIFFELFALQRKIFSRSSACFV